MKLSPDYGMNLVASTLSAFGGIVRVKGNRVSDILPLTTVTPEIFPQKSSVTIHINLLFLLRVCGCAPSLLSLGLYNCYIRTEFIVTDANTSPNHVCIYVCANIHLLCPIQTKPKQN